MEERLKPSPNSITRLTTQGGMSNGHSRRLSLGGGEALPKPSSNGILSRKTKLQSRNSPRIFDGSSSSLDSENTISSANGRENVFSNSSDEIHINGTTTARENGDRSGVDKIKCENEDYISGMLYDILQKEVITLRKACNEKDRSLKDKDDAIEVHYYLICFWFTSLSFSLLIKLFLFFQMLAKKVEMLNKAMEVESKKMRREVAAMEKEVAAMRIGKESDQRLRRASASKGPVNRYSTPVR